MLLLALLGACAADGPGPGAQIEAPVRTTPVFAGQPARVFVLASFGADCKASGAPEIEIERQPTKGAVSFRPGQDTTIQGDTNARCNGQHVRGTGIYFTAHAGATGVDSFSIVARSGRDQPVTRTFTVQIAE